MTVLKDRPVPGPARRRRPGGVGPPPGRARRLARRREDRAVLAWFDANPPRCLALVPDRGRRSSSMPSTGPAMVHPKSRATA